MTTWYSKSDEFQGIIIDEVTGDTIAVTYEPDNARKIVEVTNRIDDIVKSIEFLSRAVKAETGNLYASHLYIAERLVEELKKFDSESNENN